MEYLNSKNYSFLLCSERSGSNFITKLLNNHTDICGPSTKHIINPLARNYFRYQPLENGDNWLNLISDILSLFNVSFSVWKTEFSVEELIKNVEVGDLFGLINYIFSKETVALNKSFCFVKEIKTYEFYPFLKHYFPNSGYIHLVRDPRDMALSWKKSPSHNGGVIAASRQWKVDQQQYLKIFELEKLKKNVVSLKYEDLIVQTEKELQKVLLQMGLNFDHTMLNMTQDELTTENANQNESWKNLSKPIMNNNFNKYEQELSDAEIKCIEAICFFEMKYFGYQPKFDWSDLQQVSSQELNDFGREELLMKDYSPEEGVKANMKAKQRIYQHITNSKRMNG